MPHIYFHCSTPHGVIVDRCGSQVEDIIEACDRAEQIVHTLIAGSSPRAVLIGAWPGVTVGEVWARVI